MKIAILGAGNVGVPLARAFAAGGHAVTLANSRGPETIRQLAASLGADAASAPGRRSQRRCPRLP